MAKKPARKKEYTYSEEMKFKWILASPFILFGILFFCSLYIASKYFINSDIWTILLILAFSICISYLYDFILKKYLVKKYGIKAVEHFKNISYIYDG